MYRAAFDRRKHGLVDDHRISLFFDFSIRGQLQQIMPRQVNFHRVPSGNYMVDGVGQPGIGYLASLAR
jgi:hypothetical protein